MTSTSLSDGSRKELTYNPLRDKVWNAVLLAICAGHVITRAYHLTHFALWHDEVFTVELARMDWRSLLDASIADLANPPLFYALLKVWIAIGGNSILWLRMLPFLVSIAGLIPLFLLCKELYLSRPVLGIALTLVTFDQLLIRYAQEIRGYCLLYLLSLISAWLLVRFAKSGKQLVVLSMTNVFLIYTHYFGVIFVATECVALSIWAVYGGRTERRSAFYFAGATALLALSFVPWLYAITHVPAAKRGFEVLQLPFNSVPGLKDIAWFYETLDGPLPLRHSGPLGLAIFLAPASVALIRKSRQRRLFLALALFSLSPVVVAFVISHWLPQSLFGSRYFITAVVPYHLLIAAGLLSLHSAALRTGLIALILSWSLWSGSAFITMPDRKVPWDLLARQIKADGVSVYTYEQHEHRPISFYGVTNSMLHSKSDFLRISDADFYIVYRDVMWPESPKPEEVFKERGYRVVQTFEVHDRYEKIIAVHLVSSLISGPPTETKRR